MSSPRPRVSRLRVLLAVVLVVAGACDSTPRPSPTPAGPEPSAGPPAKVPGDLALEACDPEGLLPCEHQAVVLVEPIAASGVALTYSTEWADGRIDRPQWNAASLGLGGWSLDILQRYDAERGILLAGDGSWRFAAAADLGNGERAVPTFDGFQSSVFDAAWRHVRTIDSVTGAILLTIAYDGAGRVTSVSGAGAGAPVSLTVDRGADGGLRFLEGAGETTTTVALDGANLLAAIGRPDGTLLGLSYVSHGLVGSWQSSGNGVYSYTWDDAGRLASATDPDGVKRVSTFAITDGVATIAVSDADGGTASFRAERSGNLISRTFTDTDGTITRLEASPDGSSRLTEADGTVTTAGAVAHPRWGLAAPILTPVVETRADGTEYRVETTTTMGAGAPGDAGAGWQTTTTAGGQRWNAAYNPATRTLTRIDPEGRSGSQVFDSEGRLVSVRLPGAAPTTYAYDGAGVLTSITVGEGGTAATTSYTYANGQATELRPDGSTREISLDPFGRLLRATTADEHLDVTQDLAGTMLQLRAGAHPATSFGYSDAGRPTAYVPPVVGEDAWYELTTYTAAGRLATIADTDGRLVELTYDPAGRVATWSFDQGTATVSYDQVTGLLTANRSPDGVATAFAYDGSLPTGIAWTGPVEGEVRMGVDGLLRTTSIDVAGGAPVSLGYDHAGTLTSIGSLAIERDATTGLPRRTSLGSVATTYDYDGAMRLVGTTTTSGSAAAITVRYTRDLLGRVTGVERTEGGGTAASSTFAYDQSGRLVSWQLGSATTTYGYDASGNRTLVAKGESRAPATFDDRDRLVRAGNVSYRYSPDGTLLGRSGGGGETVYDFDDLGALRSVVLPNGRRIDYVIDAGGRRIGRKIDGKLTDGYLYGVDDTIVAWLDGSGHVRAQFAYDDAGRLALVRQDGRELVVVTDQLGSPIALLDGERDVTVGVTSYDAWGNVLGEGSIALPIGFAGGLVDSETGFVHFGARDYDPVAGRWTAPDPLRHDGGDANLYRYAGGDPVNSIDPTGTTACAASHCASRGTVSRNSPQPIGGGRSWTGGHGGGGASGGTYHDSGPSRGTGRHPSQPRRPGGGWSDYNDGPLGGSYPRPEQPPSGGNVGAWKNSFTLCSGKFCFTEDRDGYGVHKQAPGGKNAFCEPAILCGPPVPGTPGKDGFCFAICRGGNPDMSDGFFCIFWCNYGEPHLLTADGLRVDFQAAGEFLVAGSGDGSFEVQARYEPSRVVRTVTMTTALTLRVGSDRVAFYRDPDTGDQSRTLVINGQAIERSDYALTLPGGGLVERLGADAIVTWPDGTRVSVHLYRKFLNFSMAPSEAVATSITGLLGARDGKRDNDLVTRDGARLDPESSDFRDRLYGEFADSWRIAQVDSLFDYRKGETTETFQLRDYPTAYVTVADLDQGARADAEALCRAMGVTEDPLLTDCIFDVGMTGDPEFAGSAATVAAAIERANVPALEIGTAIAREQSVSGQLAAGAIDRYHFTAVAGDIVYLDAEAACSAAVSWRLVRPAGGLQNFATGCSDIGRLVLPATGEWRIEIYSDTDAAGTYAFRVLTVPAPTVRSIAPGGSASGTATVPGEWHRYTLTATAGQVLYLDAEGACDSPMSWRLINPGGSLVTFETACTDLGRRVLDAAGDWTIEVYSDDLDTGAYAFRVIGAPAPRVRAVAVGDTIADATTQVGEWHRYRLTATKGQIIYLDALGTCVPGLSWQLLRPDGTLFTFATTCTDMGRRVLEVAGEWVIEIYAPELATGAYSFKVIGAPAVQLKAIAIGQRVTDAIDAVGEWHRYRLVASAGQKVVIDAGTNCVADLWWRLLRPDGTLSTFANTCTDSGVQTLEVAGTWAIEIYSDTLATGAYDLTVKTAP